MAHLEELVYQRLCSNCPKAKECHDNCEHCDDYYDELVWEQAFEEKRKEKK